MKIYNPNIARFLVQSKLDTLSRPSESQEQNPQLLKLKKACQDFEAIFISYMLKTMNKTTESSDLFGEGLGGDIYKEIFNEKLAEHMSQSGQFKIGDLIYERYVKLVKGTENVKPLNYKIPPRTSVPNYMDSRLKLRETEAKPDRTAVHPETLVPPPEKTEKTGKTSGPGSLSDYESIIRKAAGEFGLKPSLIKAVIKHESAGNPKAVSDKGAKGLMQLIDSTAAMLGVTDPFNPAQNIMGGAKYLSSLLKKFGGDIARALASYNAGPAAVEKYGGIPPFPETRKYVRNVMASMNSE